MTTTLNRRLPRIPLAAVLLLAFISLGCYLEIRYLGSLPQWILLVENERDAMRIRMTTTESDAPIYEVVVPGEKLTSAPVRLLATEAESRQVDGIVTLFMDRTWGPGRWVFKVDSIHLDCQPVRIIVDGVEYSPPAVVTLDNPRKEPAYIPPSSY